MAMGGDRHLGDAGAHGVACAVRCQLGGALLERFQIGRCRRIEREARQVAVDVAVDGDLARPHEAPVDSGLAPGIENRARMLVERRRTVEIVLADGRLDGAGIEVAQAAAHLGVGLRRLPAAVFALVTQFVDRRPAELPQMGAVAPRRRCVLAEAGQAVGDACVVNFDGRAMGQLADGAGSPVEARLDHRFEKAALNRADGLGQGAFLQILEHRHGACNCFQCRFALQGGEAGLGMVHQAAHARGELSVELAREHLVDTNRVFVGWPRFGRRPCHGHGRVNDCCHVVCFLSDKEKPAGFPPPAGGLVCLTL